MKNREQWREIVQENKAYPELLRRGEGRKERGKEGRKKGRKEGRKEGSQEGRKEGRKERRKEGIPRISSS
jgi:flagellar biosynthesis/type III secretory pathway protein FliH